MANASYWQRRAATIARQAGIPASIFLKQIKQESGFNPNARSSAGAIGIAQIVPKYHPTVDPTNPEASLRYAANYMAGLYRKYGNWKDPLSVYNSGRPWAEGQKIGETNNYVHSILGGVGNVGGPGPGSMAPTSAAGAGGGDFRTAMAAQLLNRKEGEPLDIMALVQARQQAQAAQQQFGPQPSANTNVTGGHGGPGNPKLDELFYDPMGGWKFGKSIGAIGGHSDHVHLADDNPQTVLRAISWAQAHGLRVGENPYVGKVNPVHVSDSYHYRTFGGKFNGRKLGEAIDVSGTPAQMAAFARWALNGR